MSLSGFHIGIVLVFFVYGLAFFSMGIALSLEIGRSPLLAERGILRPLAIFGLLHGMHEWIEILLLQGVWLGLPFPPSLAGLRVAVLILSFIPLIMFGVRGLWPSIRPRMTPIIIILGALIYFLVLQEINHLLGANNTVARSDALARYLLAIPGSIMAALAMRSRARQVRCENRLRLANCFFWAAVGFAIYGVTQAFVSKTDFFPASLIDSDLFINTFGVPIQVFRAAMAVLVTVNLLQAIQVVEQEREQQLLTAQQARLEALERVQQELVEREDMRRELLRHTVIAQEEERTRIARELHDETAQLLTAFSLNLATLRSALPKKSSSEQLVGRLVDLSRQMSQGIYRLVHDLRPAQLDDLGLVPALQYLIDECKQRIGLSVTMEVSGERRRLDSLVETVIFRIAQEGLTNVGRHAQVSIASIHLEYSPGEVRFQVSDGGVGFDPNQILIPPHGWGLAGMWERVESVGGQMKIESQPGKGTLVKVTIPVKEPEPAEFEENVHGEKYPLDVGR